ncbi:YigZ family protein [Aestuariirhabdus sp. Z084]|uniref:YigZ family protein n=1 Tax=Aestuariirhabdus haliotis TaxID=2918751 RepID=UPI00201B4138|nr:YigZ family protein [Aestuariirhabdus haliotis]MCL6417555.1 YigZ family protein [Aestuariirhabdus haliotis]MCL6421490.1 YigZ family protein [Aestuariirhabdus haliotis]
MSASYLAPEAPARVELEIKRSQFRVFLEPVVSREQALECLQALRQRYPDARHHCWAYRIGTPFSPSAEACSDDGEPQGTAGKPMLNVLQHQSISDLMVVVVRYFGGIKLGAGGLVRAYSESVQRVVDEVRLSRRYPMQQCRISCSFEYETALRKALALVHGRLLRVDYGLGVTLAIELPVDAVADFRRTAQDTCRGKMDFETE